MRLVCYVYANGERKIYTTSDNGLRILKVFEGSPKVRPKQVRRITAFIEIGYANNDVGYEQAKEALERLQHLFEASDTVHREPLTMLASQKSP